MCLLVGDSIIMQVAP